VRPIKAGIVTTEAEFSAYCGIFCIGPGAYGKTFFFNGVKYKVIGLDLGRLEFPVVTEDIYTGRRVYFRSDIVSRIDPWGSAC